MTAHRSLPGPVRCFICRAWFGPSGTSGGAGLLGGVCRRTHAEPLGPSSPVPSCARRAEPGPPNADEHMAHVHSALMQATVNTSPQKRKQHLFRVLKAGAPGARLQVTELTRLESSRRSRSYRSPASEVSVSRAASRLGQDWRETCCQATGSIRCAVRRATVPSAEGAMGPQSAPSEEAEDLEVNRQRIQRRLLGRRELGQVDALDGGLVLVNRRRPAKYG